MGTYFGTDGFRGEAGKVVTAERAFAIGRVLGRYYGQEKRHPRAVIGKDTRRSSYCLEYAVASGLCASGADAYIMHVTTTPCVAYTVGADGMDFGIMISASHNPYTDNGIKVINSKGEKIGEEVIASLEKMMESAHALPHAIGEDIGRIVDYYEGRNRYIGYLISTARHSFSGLKIGLDCANGSAFNIARAVFGALGADITAIGTEPDGININDRLGSTHPERLAALVKERSLDIGLAFDGDADRCIAVDEKGRIVDGDGILYVLASKMKERSELISDTVVTTVMSNLGLIKALDAIGIKHKSVAVGDRFIYEEMEKGGYAIGAEQSGHLIVKKYSSTGDGILTGIRLCEEMLDSDRSLSELASPFAPLPQITVSVRVRDKAVADAPEVKAEKRRIEEALGDCGRIILRKSGTEPVVRIMAECESESEARRITSTLSSLIEKLDREGAE